MQQLPLHWDMQLNAAKIQPSCWPLLRSNDTRGAQALLGLGAFCLCFSQGSTGILETSRLPTWINKNEEEHGLHFTRFCQPTQPITCTNYGNHVQIIMRSETVYYVVENPHMIRLCEK